MEFRERAIAPVTVTDTDIDRFLDRRGGNIRIPERRDLRIVLTRTRTAGPAAKHELLTGAKWSVRPIVLGQAQQRALDRFVVGFNARWGSRTVCAPRYADYPACVSRG